MELGAITLHAILSDALLRHVFKYYLISVYVPENFLFREAVEEYHGMFDDPFASLEVVQGRKKKAQQIVERFLRSDGPSEVITSSKTKKKIKEAITGIVKVNLFDEALGETDTSMAATIPQFLRSDIYSLVLAHREEAAWLFGGVVSSTVCPVNNNDDNDDDNEERRGGHDDDDDDDDGNVMLFCCGRRRQETTTTTTTTMMSSNDWIEVWDGGVKQNVMRIEQDRVLMWWRWHVMKHGTWLRKNGRHWEVVEKASYISHVQQIRVVDPTHVTMNTN